MTITVRDINFYRFASVLALRAKHASLTLNSIPVSINAEIGYGGARLMDVRWTGFETISMLCDCLFYCSDNVKLRLVGSSAGNIIIYSLAMVLGMKGVCCGFDTKNPQRRGRSLRRDIFKRATGLVIPEDVECVCECVRRISDLLLEVVAIQEHPAWHNNDSEGSNISNIKFTSRHELSTEIIKELFEGKETAESILSSIGKGTAASGFSDLYIEAPVQYVLNMYRAIDGLEGRVGALYLISRFMILFCAKWYDMESVETLRGRCGLYIGAKKSSGNEGYIFSDIIDDVPLYRLPLGQNKTDIIMEDVDTFNMGMDMLMDSIDVREIIRDASMVTRVVEAVWSEELRRLRVRTNATFLDVENWRWSGRISSPRIFDHGDFEIMSREQTTTDIMTNNKGGTLPDFEAMVIRSASREFTPTPLCWNYIFEISPQSKHLFPLERVSVIFEASTPQISDWQLKVLHKRNGRNVFVFGTRAHEI
uniref:Uncharacterized protein n=1 Tax=Chionoecetes opilio bacilliform virus TaxID=1825681 RepID=A0A1Q3DLB2_9VIRU|nr:wsv269-like protein [Chionoecetes opilio bacilliform virus]GAV93252.1 hypothetical protein SCV_132 [Chionoecetes opilio bacilliform virus]